MSKHNVMCKLRWKVWSYHKVEIPNVAVETSINRVRFSIAFETILPIIHIVIQTCAFVLHYKCIRIVLIFFNFTDADICTEGSNDCAENANCTNVDGNFTCICNSGYAGNGTVCEG